MEFAHESRRRKVRNVSAMKAEFHRIREDNPGTDPRPLGVYCGRYRNVLGNFFIEIRQSLKDAHLLELLFLGREEQMYQLRHLQGDMFEWAPDYDEQARRAQFTTWDTAYFQIGFHFKDGDEASSLEWAGGQTLVALHQS